LKTGEPVDIFALLENSEPPIILPRVHVKVHAEAGTLANRALHERHRLALKLSQATDAEIRASHAISEEAQRALVEGDGARFLRLRAEILVGVVAQFLAARAEFGADDGPPVDALEIGDPDHEGIGAPGD
jgi:hypothetical protein